MQCRNAARQRLAACRRAQSQPINAQAQYIWTSDELLAEAFARFASVSRTSRRFESNVPGPLEARKRLARRRYGLASAAAPAERSQSLIGTLFGAPKDTTGVFTWQPPAVCSTSRPDPEPSSGDVVDTAAWWPSWMEPPREHSTGEQSVSADAQVQNDDKSHSEEKKVKESVPQDVDGRMNIQMTRAPLVDSLQTGAGSKLQEQVSSRMAAPDDETILHSAYGPVELSSTANDVEAHSISDFLELSAVVDNTKPVTTAIPAAERALTKQLIDFDALQAFCNGTMVKLKSSPSWYDDTMEAINVVTGAVPWRRHADPMRSCEAILHLYDNIIHHISREMTALSPTQLDALRRRLFSAAKTYVQLHPQDYASCMLSGNLLLRLCRGYQWTSTQPHLLVDSLATLLSRLPSHKLTRNDGSDSEADELLAIFVSILNTSSDRNLVPMVMSKHLQRWSRHPQAASSLNRVNFWIRCVHRSNRFAQSGREQVLVRHSWAMYQQLSQYYAFGTLRELNWLPQKQLATALLVGWALPHSPVGIEQKYASTELQLSPGLDICFDRLQQQDADDGAIATMLQHMQNNGVPYQDILRQIIQSCWSINGRWNIHRQVCATGLHVEDDTTVILVKQLTKKAWLSKAIQLVLETPSIHDHRIDDLISSIVTQGTTRPETAPRLLCLFGRDTGKNGAGKTAVNNLVERLAYAYAHCEGAGRTTCFRRVHECYLFLKRRKADMSPMMTRALTWVAGTRAVKETKGFSPRRMSYVMDIVHRVEGEKIAKALDKELYHIFRGRQRSF